MTSIAAYIRSHPVTMFSLATIGLSFGTYLLPLPRETLPFVIVLVPAAVALILTATTEGHKGVRGWLGQLAPGRLGLKWVGVALVLAFGLRLGISLVALGLGLIPSIQIRATTLAQSVLLAAILFLSAALEELGWRGYALRRLLAQRSPLAAGLIIGVGWGVVHLALTLPGMLYAGQSPLALFLEIVGLSLLITWLYVQSGGSLLLTSLFHAAQSFFEFVNGGIPVAQLMWLMVLVYGLAGLALLVVARKAVRHPALSDLEAA